MPSPRGTPLRPLAAAGIAGVIIASVLFLATPRSSVLETPGEQVNTSEIAYPPGALVGVSFDGQVGVLLDEIPKSVRDRAADTSLSQDDSFWAERAKEQIRLMSYRLIFRDSFYDESEAKGALPLPPEDVWDIEIKSSPRRSTVGSGHDAVTVDYSFSSTLLTDIHSPAASEPSLGTVGGKWSEHFILPLDPTLLFQRTRFACMDENQFPPHSVDAEETDTFYDQETDVEDELSIEGFHQTEMPEMSCIEALDLKVGKIEADLEFERLAWDSALADKVRTGKVTNLEGPDLEVEDSVFQNHQVAYRYIEPDDCSLAEGAVEDSGWRRLLQFSAADRNVGAQNLDIGDVDYYIEGIDTSLADRGIYEYSLCHDHYHFVHYGTFSLGDTENHKMGFCLQSTNRFSNNEFSPLPNRYSGCDYQGIESGWVDEYKIGLQGQWVDITDVETSDGPVMSVLQFHSNPLGFLCEGSLVTDSDGITVYEMTELKTNDGHSVFKPRCTYADGALDNNIDSYQVTLPTDGNGYVTDECSGQEIGPLRDCGLMKTAVVFNCTPGEEVSLRAEIVRGAYPQLFRICEYSAALQTAIPCTYNGPENAQSIANAMVESSTDIEFLCPEALDENEPGGKFSIYYGPVLPRDPIAEISFTLL